jgi:hypothetical protein
MLKGNKPVLFFGSMQHSYFKNDKPESAGFVLIVNLNGEYRAKAYGESISLDLKSKEEDTAIINACINSM